MKTEVMVKQLVGKFESTFITPDSLFKYIIRSKNIFNDNKTAKASEKLNTRQTDSCA